MKIVIIDYGAGNVQSVQFALNRMGLEGILSSDPEVIRSADRVIFPGVGEAGSAMRKICASGLDKVIPELKQPVLGICLGMQLLCNHSEESDTPGMGIFDVNVKRFTNQLKVPQIGWNTINDLNSELFTNVREREHMYLVHSYYVPICKMTSSVTNYGIPYSSALERANFYGVQFHPEKSGRTGQKIIENFIKLSL